MGLKEKQEEVFEKLESGTGNNTVVTTDSDYYTDPKIGLTKIYLLHDELKDRISELVIDPLKEKDSSQFFLPYSSLHFTVQNIKIIADSPNFTEADIEKVKSLKEWVANQKPLSYRLKGLYRLPLSVGVKAFPSEDTHDFILALRTKLVEMGIHDDKVYIDYKTPIGNISLCRFYKEPNEGFLNTFDKLKDVDFGELRIDNFDLIVSNAACNKDNRKIVETFSLGI